MICNKCGANIPDGVKFCTSCGAPVEAAPVETPAPVVEAPAMPETNPTFNQAPMGGAPMGGAPMGGAPMGGAPMGGTPMGGAPMGGTPMGGAPMGGMPTGSIPSTPAPAPKKSKKGLIIGIVAAVVIIALIGIFAGGDNTQEKLQGTWQTNKAVGSDNAEIILDNAGFDDYEIEAIQTVSSIELSYFTDLTVSGSNYSFSFNEEATKSKAETDLGEIMEYLYENMDTVYAGTEFEVISEVGIASLEEFKEVYASLYDYNSYDQYESRVVSSLVDDYKSITNVTDSGTFTVNDDQLEMSPVGEEGYVVDVMVQDLTLTLTYEDGPVIFMKQA